MTLFADNEEPNPSTHDEEMEKEVMDTTKAKAAKEVAIPRDKERARNDPYDDATHFAQSRSRHDVVHCRPDVFATGVFDDEGQAYIVQKHVGPHIDMTSTDNLHPGEIRPEDNARDWLEPLEDADVFECNTATLYRNYTELQ